MVDEIHIPDSVDELCEECFLECKGRAFKSSGVTEVHMPGDIDRLLRDRSTALPPLCRVMKLA